MRMRRVARDMSGSGKMGVGIERTLATGSQARKDLPPGPIGVPRRSAYAGGHGQLPRFSAPAAHLAHDAEPRTVTRPAAGEPLRTTGRYGEPLEVFSLPTDEAFLRELLTELFTEHWSEIVFGPIMEGAAFELRCASPPHRISLLDGYLTVDLGGPHFHLCIGPTRGMSVRPTPPVQQRHRRVKRALLFRGLDDRDCPVTWGLSLANGLDEPVLTVFFPNPLLTDEGRPTRTPDWSRLALWDALLRRHLGRGPDPRDRTASRFQHR